MNGRVKAITAFTETFWLLAGLDEGPAPLLPTISIITTVANLPRSMGNSLGGTDRLIDDDSGNIGRIIGPKAPHPTSDSHPRPVIRNKVARRRHTRATGAKLIPDLKILRYIDLRARPRGNGPHEDTRVGGAAFNGASPSPCRPMRANMGFQK